MRILVLGGDGMLGHKLLRILSPAHEVKVTLRSALPKAAGAGLFHAANAYGGVDVRDASALRAAIADFRPELVVNAVGLVTQRAGEQDVVAHLEVNALFPHRLYAMCREAGARLIHVSTDGVFSGARGNYAETDAPDPVDTYGRCKLLGEVAGEGALTLRTAIVGLGLARRTGLVDWFLGQTGEAKGYRNAVFSGLTTREFSRVIGRLAGGGGSGLYHVSSDAISKYDLLAGLKERLGLAVRLVPADEPRIDRSLDSSRFRAAFAYSPPSWSRMLDELADEIRARKA